MKTTLRFAPRVLTHLGEALVPAVDQALIELVKNAFDADATKCQVRIDDVGGGTEIEISDNGRGMALDELQDGWLIVGSSEKVRSRRTARFNRVVVGDKGLGRLAALRLGHTAELYTRSTKSHSEPYAIRIDWRKYRNVKAVDEVPIEILAGDRRRSTGTTIRVVGCPPLRDASIRRIARALTLLNDPFRDNTGFSVSLTGSAAQRARVRFTKRFFPYFNYRLHAKLQNDGSLSVRLTENNGRQYTNKLKGPFKTVPFSFDLWEYRLLRDSYSARDFPLDDIREWLRVFGGVHVFSGPIRIAPYGDRPVDWLDMNAMRAASPEHRPSTNNSIGRVVIDNTTDQIVQTTDRVSFIDNESYHDLREACRSAIVWAARLRSNRAEKERQKRRQEAAKAERATTDAFRLVRETLTDSQLAVIEPALQAAFAARQEEVAALRADVVLYRAMATAGIAASVFAHEIGQPLTTLQANLSKIADALKADSRLARAVQHISEAIGRLAPYVQLPLKYASKARRKTARIDAVRAVDQSLDILKPILDEGNIDLARKYDSENVMIIASPAMVDAIMGNFVTNSITAFRQQNSERKRRVRVSIEAAKSTFTLRYVDNAGGITNLSLDKIWSPGETTTPGGTGFGLTIVRDTVTDLRGSVAVNPRTRFGGAEFIVTLPRASA